MRGPIGVGPVIYDRRLLPECRVIEFAAVEVIYQQIYDLSVLMDFTSLPRGAGRPVD